jgi:HAD superfamily hydrolase (TIGR01509 family)
MAKDFDYLLFDLGGVLVELAGIPRMLEWMEYRMDADGLNKKWLYSRAVRDYERGRISSKEFAEGMVEEFALTIDAESFLKEYEYFPKDFYPGARELLTDLSKKYRVAVLSNTNELHWNRFGREECLAGFADRCFVSHITGFMKPDAEAFLHVIDRLDCRPERILFFDDNLPNVEAALSTGMQAEHVSDFKDLKKRLGELGII